MNYVLRSHGEFDWHAHWNVEFINFLNALGVLHLPHPLLPNHKDFSRILRRNANCEKKGRTPIRTSQHTVPAGITVHVTLQS